MASFPGSVKVFTTKNNGDTIQPADVNDLQDEVSAIEDGFRNATAPLNSSRSTVATLSVTGNSTIAGELFVSKSAPFCVVRSSAATQVANNTPTEISFDINDHVSTSVMHSTSSNPTRVVFPSSGVYAIRGSVTWNAFSTAGFRYLDILRASTQVMARTLTAASDYGVLVQTVATEFVFQTNDFVELRVTQDSGTTGSIATVGTLAGAFFTPSLAVTKIR